MKSYIQKREKALILRKEGMSYGEICAELKVSRAILSKWLSKVPLAESQKNELKKRMDGKMMRGRLNARIFHKSKKIVRENEIFRQAEVEFESNIKDSLFLVGLALYLAKGSTKKPPFQLTSSNKVIVKVMSDWAVKYLNLSRDNIRYKQYKDSVRVHISGIDVWRKVIAWQKLLIQYYDRVVKNDV